MQGTPWCCSDCFCLPNVVNNSEALFIIRSVSCTAPAAEAAEQQLPAAWGLQRPSSEPVQGGMSLTTPCQLVWTPACPPFHMPSNL